MTIILCFNDFIYDNYTKPYGLINARIVEALAVEVFEGTFESTLCHPF